LIFSDRLRVTADAGLRAEAAELAETTAELSTKHAKQAERSGGMQAAEKVSLPR